MSIKAILKNMTLRKDRALGVSETHSYDIPLDRGSGRVFLTALIGLMVFLALLSVTAASALTNFANQWQTGLEGRWTIEIPALDNEDNPIPRDQLYLIAGDIIGVATNFTAVSEVTLLEEEDILSLIEPWFDADVNDKLNLPLPVLISLNMNDPSIIVAKDLIDEIHNIHPLARLDHHEVWLGQLLKLTGTLRFTAYLFTMIICAAGIFAIAGAMQSRLAEHRESIELLHLMGANDHYISKQFERHSAVMAAIGGCISLILTFIFLYILKWSLTGSSVTLLPSFQPTTLFWVMLFCVPIITIALCAVTTRWTVLRTLRQML